MFYNQNNFSTPLRFMLNFSSSFSSSLSLSISFVVVYTYLVEWCAHSFLFYLDNENLQPENCLTSYEPHGYCVIYSSADRDSFILAERILQTLWTSENIAQRAVILVGNKADLARSRTVTSEGECCCLLCN